ncbi:Rad60/SUMO-like domain containing protein [Trema orientale]|uniref:Rad60/SUMO-like domain containing protein n=1 Tax=Trema orientale TaxID=63057 RepID=A0A2P5ET39_TREOI|nr:Rad60/SUMO-like domain containing protein [Trema orientale]
MDSNSNKRKSMEVAPGDDNDQDDDDGIPTLGITVLSQGTATSETYFQIKINCPLFKLLKTFCRHQNVDYKTMQFLYNGKRIHPKQTPKSLNMKDGDQIDAISHIDGGGAF